MAEKASKPQIFCSSTWITQNYGISYSTLRRIVKSNPDFPQPLDLLTHHKRYLITAVRDFFNRHCGVNTAPAVDAGEKKAL